MLAQARSLFTPHSLELELFHYKRSAVKHQAVSPKGPKNIAQGAGQRNRAAHVAPQIPTYPMRVYAVLLRKHTESP